ncbi:MAG: four helix bundle protein [Candidatus Brocadia sp.]|nr:four helix bundle protein [Candidatus Brocadia sp.]MCE7912900.1 four helix bundle protein [Candidatus Brocadia sp. AMX3]MDG5997485.1 four helix bundle protein [Candidatus Brocadia sp.]OQY98611.1 MAG: four helix bundle protein [Candidatus Brocadia sp. UTAMX2]RIJ91251.1 MAG: four helix bundle protein [Candidatus Brocadia sp.]
MTTVKSYRDLIVWQKSITLTKKIYAFTQLFPKEEIYGLTSQMRRAAVSIACNIAEGQARNSTGEFIQFLGISKGSLAELETLQLLSKEMNFLTEENYLTLSNNCAEINKLLTALIKSLSTRH